MLRGRDEVISLLGRWLAGLRAGEGGSIQVLGAPGIGKTAVLEATAQLARDSGLRILRAIGHPEESGIAWAGLSQLLAPHLAVLTDLEELPRTSLMRTLRLIDHGAVDEVAVGMSLLYFLTFFDEPTAVLIDDLQWMDHATLTVLRFVSRRLQATGVGMLAVGHPETPMIHGSRITLEPLSAADLRAIGRDRGAASAVAEVLAQHAMGMPLVLDQMIESLDHSQLSGRTPLPEPLAEIGEVTATLDARLRTLGGPALTVMAAAALAPYRSVSDLTRELEVADPLDVLAPALEAGLVSILAERVEFRHPSVRTAAIRSISDTEKRRIHQLLARDAEVQHRGWHLAAAATGTDDAAAAALVDLAADAASRGAHLIALRARQTAIGLCTGPRPDWALAAAHDAVHARLASVAKDLSAQCPPGPSSSALSAEIAWVEGRVADARAIWTDVSQDPTAPEELRVHCRRRAAIASFRMYDGPGVMRLREEGAASDPILDLVVAGALVIGGQPEALDRLLSISHVLLQGPRDPERISALAEVMALALARSGRSEELSQIVEQVNELAAAHAAHAVPALLIAQAAHRSRSDLPGALAIIRQALALSEEWDLTEHRPFALAIAAVCEASVDGPDAPDLIAGIRSYPVPVAQAVADYSEALCHYGRGEFAAALSVLAPLHARHPREKSFGFLWHADLIDIALRVGDHDLAHQVAADLESWAGESLNQWIHATHWRAQGLVATEREEADALFEKAAEQFERSGYTITAGRTRLDWAERLRRDRQRSAARTQLARARELLVAGGARRWIERCEREAEILGLNPTPAATLSLESLSPRELQVARWLAAGLTFRQIGTRLFMSPRTAESHGQAIYRKLGVRGRAELADLARRNPALAGPTE